MELIERPYYLGWLRQWQGHDLIKVLTGMRRCGKSTILELFQRDLITRGVTSDQILSINLEDPDTERTLVSGLALYDYVKAHMVQDKTTYVFIDEAQHLEEFERTVAGLNLLKGIDVYLTGSNSRFLAGDLATRLTGRYVELAVLPLSYAEYLSAVSRNATDSSNATIDPFERYLRYGGFPYVPSLNDNETMVRQYLSGVLNTVLVKDVAPRQTSFSPSALNSIVEFMFDNVGNLASINKISDTMTSMGRKLGRSAVENYVEGLVDAYVLYPAQRYDIKGKMYLSTNEKYYIVDTGLRRALLGSRNADLGHVLENVVYLELRRRFSRISVGKIGSSEVDFVAESADGPTYFQVAQSVEDPATLERELASLRSIPDHYPRFLIVGDTAQSTSYDGIRRINIREWLLTE